MPAPIHPTRTYDRAQGPNQVITILVPPQVFTQSLTATLSFTGAFTKGLLYLRSFTATLFQSGGGSLATDNFNRGNGALGANWGSVTGLLDLTVVSNQAEASASGTNSGNRYTAVSAPNDQYSKVTLTTMKADTNTGIGAAVRMASGAVTMYLLQGNTIETTMFKAVSNVFTQLGSTAAASAVNDVLQIEAVGTTITGKKNGVTIIGPVTDSAIASGAWGIWASNPSAGVIDLDNWEGGTPGAAGVAATLGRKPLKALAATFSPAAAIARKIIDSGFVATLSFVGSTTKKIVDAGFTATRSFVGNLGISKTFVRAFTATANFAGALIRKIVDSGFAATFSPVAALTKRITHGAFTATLSFVGAIARNVGRNLTATLSFVGNLATSFIAGGGHVFTQSYAATLSFVGAATKLPQKVFAATLSDSAALVKRYAKAGFAASLSFVGAIAKRYLDAGFAATQSFTGFLTQSKSFLKSFTATLSFVGNLATATHHFFLQSYSATLNFTGGLNRKLSKGLSATLSFIGNLATTFIAGSHTFTQAFTATLSSAATLSRSTRKSLSATFAPLASLLKRITRTFTGTLSSAGAVVKAYRDAGFFATLSFTGTLGTLVAHFFTRSFTATLSFAGSLTSRRTIAKVLAATLAFSVVIRRQTAKSLAATLNFSTAIRRRTAKLLSGAVSFAGFLFRGGAVTVLAGWITKCLATIGISGSTANVFRAESQLTVEKLDESGVQIQTTSSQLTVERTK